MCDWDSLSSHQARRASDLTNLRFEIEQTNYLLDDIDKSLPKDCKKYLIGGNHEARYESFKINKATDERIRQLHTFTSWQTEYDLFGRRWNYCDYGECVEIGHLVFTHGWYSSGNHASRHLGLFHKNIIYGHTHQFQVATAVGINGEPVLSASIGTLSKKELSYLVGKPPVNWLNMFMYIDMYDDGTFTPHFVPIVNGRFYELGREFNATLRL